MHQDGRPYELMEMHAGPVHNDAGEMVAAVAVAMDVTERDVAEARQAFLFRLQDSLRALSDPTLLNLCINARDAMPDGGHLIIETSNCVLTDAEAKELELAGTECVLLTVSDTGSGMSAAVIQRAFENRSRWKRWDCESGRSSRRRNSVQAPAVGQYKRPPSGTVWSGRISTTAPFSSGNPRVRTSDMNLPICRGGKFTTASTCRPSKVSAA